MLKKIVVLTVCIVVTAVLAACGGSDDKAEVTINVKAENNRFVPDRIEIPAGKTVKLTLQNLDEADHDLEVKGLNPKVTSGGGHGGMDMDKSSPMDALTVHSQKKKSATVTFVAERAGTYDFICTQPGHKEVGMVGKLVVTGADGKPVASAGNASPTPTSPASPPTASSGMAQQAPQLTLPEGHEGH